MRKGNRGGYTLRTDAGRTTPYPNCDRWTIHASLCPNTNITLIPDVVQYLNIYHPNEISNTTHHTLHILEVAYANDRDKRIVEKTTKYQPLLDALHSAEHNATLSVLCLNTSVPITNSDTPTLQALGIDNDALHDTRKQIWTHSIQYMYKLITNWRRLEALHNKKRSMHTQMKHIRSPPWGTAPRPSAYTSMTCGRPPD